MCIERRRGPSTLLKRQRWLFLLQNTFFTMILDCKKLSNIFELMTKPGYGVAAAPTNTTVDKTPSAVHQVHHQTALTTMKKSRDFWRKKPSLALIALMNSKRFLLILIAQNWKFSRPRPPRKPVVKKDLSQVWPLMQSFVRSTNPVGKTTCQTVIACLCLVRFFWTFQK